MRTYPSAAGTTMLVLGPGAGAGEDHPWMRRVGQGLARRGVSVVSFDFPYRLAGRRVPDRGPVLEAAFAEAYAQAAKTAPGRVLLAGGKSLGGRIASQAAAAGALTPGPAGLVFFGYPLHPPGRASQRRDRHLPAIRVPLLFLHGTRDPFGSPDEMRALVAGLARARLELVDQGDHSLMAPRRVDPAGSGFERTLDLAAAWIGTLA